MGTLHIVVTTPDEGVPGVSIVLHARYRGDFPARTLERFLPSLVRLPVTNLLGRKRVRRKLDQGFSNPFLSTIGR